MSFLRVRASERYLVLEFGFNLNKGCSGWERVGMVFQHLFFRTTPLRIPPAGKSVGGLFRTSLFHTTDFYHYDLMLLKNFCTHR